MISTHVISTEKQRSTSEVNSRGPVFVTGMNGSGTTLVLRILDRHPNLYAFPGETKIMPHFILTLNRYGDLNVDDNFLRLWNDIRRYRVSVSPINALRLLCPKIGRSSPVTYLLFSTLCLVFLLQRRESIDGVKRPRCMLFT